MTGEIIAAYVALAVFLLDLLTIVTVIFYERKQPTTIVTWTLAIMLLPLLGCFFYFVLGRGPDMGKRKKFMEKYDKDNDFVALLDRQISKLDKSQDKVGDLIEFNLKYNKSLLTVHNDVKLYTDMTAHFDEMFEEIRNATQFVNVLYFIIRPDKRGRAFVDLLAQKAKEGVKVRLVYDAVGSVTTRNGFFRKARKAGVEIYKFLPRGLFRITKNINYRNHRKVVIIDNKVAFTGGANIGDEYESRHKRITPWRDSHLRLVGEVVFMLNIRFMQDFNFAAKQEQTVDEVLPSDTGKLIPMQVVSGGPDTDSEGIKYSYIKAINAAKRRILIQTPYFIPDEPFIQALILAAQSGVDVCIMIPKVPDKKTVYYATLSYVTTLLRYGIKVFRYHGFVHAKTLVVDDEIASVGTFNLDCRSFKLHFEMTTFIYDRDFVGKLADAFIADMLKSDLLPVNFHDQKSTFQKFKESLFRLFSPIF